MPPVRTIRRPTRRPKSKKTNVFFRFLPESVQVFLARRIVDITAVTFILAGLFILVSMLSYHHGDPSLNAAGADDSIHNWGGAWGAIISDVLIQTIGIGGAVLGVGIVIWGMRLLHRHPVRPFSLRFVALLMASMASALAFSQSLAGGWESVTYLGGSFGTILMDRLGNLGSFFDFVDLPFMAGIASIGLFLFAAAVKKNELIFTFGFIKDLAVFAVSYIYQTIRNFVDWVIHHNQSGYKPRVLNLKVPQFKSSAKRRALPKITRDESETRALPPVPTEPISPPLATKAQSDIPVVAAPKSTQHALTQKSQTQFVYEGEWQLPEPTLLTPPPTDVHAGQLDENALRRNAEMLQTVLADFKVEGEVVSIHPGPVVTLYEFEPAPGVKSSKVINLSDDIARSMSAVSVRCAVVPGRSVIGIELPNKQRQFVHMQTLLMSRLFEKSKARLPLILGKDIGGQPIMADLSKMPHLLVAGTTGSGKSVAVNSMILSLLYRLSPEQCRFIMIDPKMLELSVYDGIPHLLSPVVTEPGKAVVALKWTVQEMEERYRKMSKLGVRNLGGYNARMRELIKNGEKLTTKIKTGFDPETGKPIYDEQEMELAELPYIVVIVDEFADLMLVAGKDVEAAIQRLAQMARAAGIHIIMATQRPSVDVITGVIKANFPTRISFSVTSKIDSRTILGEGGAEQLLGMGDMLYMAPGGRITRVHGPFVSDSDVEKVVAFLKSQGNPSYVDDITDEDGLEASDVMAAIFDDRKTLTENKVDELYDQAVALVAREGKASTSFVQRYLQIGYNRAARIIEEMEAQGIISKATKTGKREVLIRDFSDV
jgi:S-DNA-T family DNA segregation ATPase FtsK/SpoIIIE